MSGTNPDSSIYRDRRTQDFNQDWLRARILDSGGQVFNVQAFGAVGDSVTDNTTAIQRMVNAGNGVRFFPPGDFYCASDITLTGSSAFRGVGRASRILFAAGKGFTGSSVNDIAFHNLMIDVGYISLTDCNRIWVEDCHLENGDGTVISLTRVTDCWIRRNRVINADLSGVRVENPGGGTNARIWVCANAFDGINTDDIAGHSAVQVHGAATQRDIWIEDNYIEDVGNVGIGVSAGSGIHINRNNVIGGAGTTEGIAVTANNSEVVGNSVHDFTTTGIILYLTTTYYHDVLIQGNQCYDNGDQGIKLSWADADNIAGTRLALNNNICFGAAQDYGIQEVRGTSTGDTAVDCSMVGNVLVGNATAGQALLHASSWLQVGNRTTSADNAVYLRQGLNVGSHIIPDASNIDIGATATRWRSYYGSGVVEITEIGAPGNGPADSVRVYAVDNGAGKTQLAAIFATGAAQVLATQP